MTYDYVIAIPSYDRPVEVTLKTVRFLWLEQIPAERVTIFVASEAEKVRYEAAQEEGSYNPKIVVGVLGLSEQLNFIFQYYPEGTRILRLDDDVKDLVWLEKKPLETLVQGMWKVCEDEGIKLWSIYPASNKKWLKERVAIGKVFCVGPFSGYVNDRKFVYPPDSSTAEDVRHSISRFITDGKTARYEGCFLVTRWRAKGGLTEYRKEKERSDVLSAIQQFPNHLKIRVKQGREEPHFRTKIEKSIPLPILPQTSPQ